MKKKIVFLNVDTQYDFMHPNGKLYIKGSESIIEKIDIVVELARICDIKVISTFDRHSIKDAEISSAPDFVNTYPQHCLEGTIGFTSVIHSVRSASGAVKFPINTVKIDKKELKESTDVFLYKNATDLFASNANALGVFNVLSPDVVVVFGVALDICVYRAVRCLIILGYNVVLLEDATAAVSSGKATMVINEFILSESVIVSTVDKFLFPNLR
jgi:nicotinamidase/pyrazinamidase